MLLLPLTTLAASPGHHHTRSPPVQTKHTQAPSPHLVHQVLKLQAHRRARQLLRCGEEKLRGRAGADWMNDASRVARVMAPAVLLCTMTTVEPESREQIQIQPQAHRVQRHGRP